MTNLSTKSLTNLSTKELQARFQAAFGEATASRNRPWLIKRLTAAQPKPKPAAKAKRSKAVAPAPTADAASGETQAPVVGVDQAAIIPLVGSEIRKMWRGQELVVQVEADGFRLGGVLYRSLSAAATALCGGNRNGLVFFGLKPRPVKAAPKAAPAKEGAA